MINNALLPFDCINSIKKRQKLVGKYKHSESGPVTLKKFKELRIGWLYCSPDQIHDDPNYGRDGCYYVPAISLIGKCKNYDPYGLLVYLPFEKMFGTWDCDHAELFVFCEITWSKILLGSVKYVNYLWAQTDGGSLLELWNTYEFKTTDERAPV